MVLLLGLTSYGAHYFFLTETKLDRYTIVIVGLYP